MSEAAKAILDEFLIESFENLSNINEELTMLEKEPNDSELLNSIFRKIHTIKGSASFLGFVKLEELTHVIENLLDQMREDEITLDSSIADVILEGFDRCLDILRFIQDSGAEPDVDLSVLIAKVAEQGEAIIEIEMPALENQLVVEKRAVSDTPDGSQKLSLVEPEQQVVVETIKKVKIPDGEDIAEEEESDSSVRTADRTANLADSTVRVSVKLLDKIMNVVGELVLNRNQILQYSKQNEDSELNRLSQQLNSITTELQTDIMTTRMQPVGTVFNKFERIVRDLSRSQSKKVNLHIQGKDTELDKTILEIIKDPMTHLIRNALDHGIEDPDTRTSLGKKEEGLVSIKAFHEGGQVIIEIRDDGSGIPVEKVLSKAISKGLVKESEANSLSKRKILNMIFQPGFSTAETVTNISGRGVGMDVVKSNLEKIGGQVEVDSDEGEGTKFRMKIPLTLAIIPALVIKGANETFAIPQKNLVELVLLEDDSETQIESLHGNEFIRLRGELIPIFRMNKTLKVNEDHRPEGITNIAVLKAEGKVYGLIVDEILDTQEIVVKPLSRKLKDQNVYAGATIMGDGRVALIIDAYGFYNMVDQGTSKTKNASEDEFGKTEPVSSTSHEVLLFNLSDERPYGIPLGLVNRFEEFKRSQLEWSGSIPLVRYRELAMPLIFLDEKFNNVDISKKVDSEDPGNDDVFPCIVIQYHGKYFGIIVDEILDIAQTENEIETETLNKSEVLGTLYIDEKLVTIADIHGVINSIFSELSVNNHKIDINNLKGRILLVEDSPLYRKVEQEIFDKTNVDVVIACNGQEALEILEKDEMFDLILTDVEMPLIDGWELTKRIRAMASSIKDVPIVAITTLVSEKDRLKGKEIGFTSHLEKLNEDEVLETVARYLA